MYCCPNCFKSPTLREFIEEKGSTDDCDFCFSENVKTIHPSDLYELFESILRMYREIEYGRDYFKDDDPYKHGELISFLVCDEWSPFSYRFDDNKHSNFFDLLIPQPMDKDDFQDHLDTSAFYTNKESYFENSWKSFSDYLKKNVVFLSGMKAYCISLNFYRSCF